MNKFLVFISHGLHQIQRTFFPDLEHEAGPIPETLVELSYILQTIHSQKVPLPEPCWTGRPPKSRRGILNAFVSKSFLGLPTTFHLIERLHSDRHLRLICGFENWNGYKLHIDTADNGIPISALLTSASVHDSQVAIPLATITARRIQNRYDLMDSAYDVPEIEELGLLVLTADQLMRLTT